MPPHLGCYLWYWVEKKRRFVRSGEEQRGMALDEVLPADNYKPVCDSFSAAKRQAVFMNGLMFFEVLLALYILAQIFALVFVEKSDVLEPWAFVLSILLNVTLFGLLLAIFFRFKKQGVQVPNCPEIYRLMMFSTAAMFVGSLFQIHLVGSLNSLHHLLIVAVLLVVSWFLRWRDVALFFIFGNLGLAAVVALEVTGYLSYAPLMVQRAELASIFLDWRVILGQAINYVFVLVVGTAWVWHLRHTLEKAEAAKESAMQKLQKSLDQVKALHGLLPICASCKNIRDDKGYWRQLESYITEHSPDIQFTHSVCPECAKQLYPEFVDKVE
jgi:hypothetical protein